MENESNIIDTRIMFEDRSMINAALRNPRVVSPDEFRGDINASLTKLENIRLARQATKKAKIIPFRPRR